MSLIEHIKLPNCVVQLFIRQHADGMCELYACEWNARGYRSFGLFPLAECNEWKAELELRMKMAEALSAK